MSEHVLDQLADLLAGRLSEAQRRNIEDHMARCSDCASQVQWSRELQDSALREGLRHIPAPRILVLARAAAAATPAEEAHLTGCATCSGEIGWAGRLPGETGIEEVDDGGSPRATRRPLARWTGAGLAAAAVILAFLLLPGGPGLDTATLATIEPLPVRITRSIPEAGSFEEARLMGLEAYAAGDYEKASGRLAEASRLRPQDEEVRLYLASTALLQGHPAEARRLLEPIADDSEAPALRHEAAWMLSQIALLEHRPADARSLLTGLAASDGRHSAAARKLLPSLPD